MARTLASHRAPAIGWVRVFVGIGTIVTLGYAYVEGFGHGRVSPLDYFGYFTNQTSLWSAIALIVAGALAIRRRTAPPWFTAVRGVSVACMLIVAVVYNVLVPGTAAAPAWVSATLHVVLPAFVAFDWLLVGDRSPLPWRWLWAVLPYPLIWLAVVLVRGRTDGWVPYGFLLPENGTLSLVLHIAGLLAALLVSGALAWWASRFRGTM